MPGERPASDTDEALLGRFQRGDARAFEELLRRHQGPVFNFLYRMVGERAAAQDLLQEVFLAVVENPAGFDGRSRLTTWLYRVARNRCVDHLRREGIRRAVSFHAPVGEDDAPLGDSLAAAAPPPDQEAESRELLRRLDRALPSLSEEQREVFVLRAILELPIKEVAEIVGRNENTVKTQDRRATESLRRLLFPESEGQP
jgi:RNA polymerase sigma-70 factor, ECF subfamily